MPPPYPLQVARQGTFLPLSQNVTFSPGRFVTFGRLDTPSTHFQQLMASEGTRLFLLDIISSRALTENVLAFNAGWAPERVPGGPDANQPAVMRSVIYHMGGFYELLYHCLRTREPLDVRAQLSPVVEAYSRAIQRRRSDSAALPFIYSIAHVCRLNFFVLDFLAYILRSIIRTSRLKIHF